MIATVANIVLSYDVEYFTFMFEITKNGHGLRLIALLENGGLLSLKGGEYKYC
jgi:hypothetical protein